jgi:hypothetical protein
VGIFASLSNALKQIEFSLFILSLSYIRNFLQQMSKNQHFILKKCYKKLWKKVISLLQGQQGKKLKEKSHVTSVYNFLMCVPELCLGMRTILMITFIS